jgi:hypothetical protein
MNNNYWIKIYAYNAVVNCLLVDLFLLYEGSYVNLLPMLGATVLNIGIAVLSTQQEIEDKKTRHRNG